MYFVTEVCTLSTPCHNAILSVQSRESRSSIPSAFETWREMDRQSRSRSNSATQIQQPSPSSSQQALQSTHGRSNSASRMQSQQPLSTQQQAHTPSAFYPDLSLGSMGSSATRVSSVFGTTTSNRESIGKVAMNDFDRKYSSLENSEPLTKFTPIDPNCPSNISDGRSYGGVGWKKVFVSSTSLPGKHLVV